MEKILTVQVWLGVWLHDSRIRALIPLRNIAPTV